MEIQVDHESGVPANTRLLKLRARPRITRAASSVSLDHITGDATEAYPRDIGLRHYVRHLLFLKPDVLIVVDDIALPVATASSPKARASRG